MARALDSVDATVVSAEFTTTFSSNENPLGSPWISPQAAGFTTLRSSGGLCYGDGGTTGDYDDSYAYLSGFNNDHECEGTVFVGSPPGGVNHEVELHVRMSDNAGTDVTKSYELLLNKDGALQVMKWNGTMAGPPDFFAELASDSITPPANGDKFRFRATTEGSDVRLRAWENRVGVGTWNEIVNVVDDGSINGAALLTGQPGVAYFSRSGSDPTQYCWTAYTARNA